MSLLLTFSQQFSLLNRNTYIVIIFKQAAAFVFGNSCCQNPNDSSTKVGFDTKKHNTQKNIKLGSSEHLEQIPTVTVAFVQAKFVLKTFVQIRNILAVTDLILNKL